MGFFDRFFPGPGAAWPYTNLQGLNLDWIISIVDDFSKKYPDIITELNNKLDKAINGNGEAGFILTSNGDGSSSWTSSTELYPQIIDTITEAVAEWLADHPEATTTVQDNSLSYKKLITGTLGFVIPEMFGAEGDGITDDSAAINSALSSGVHVIIPANRTYLIEQNISVPSNTHLTINGTIKAGAIGNVSISLFDGTETPLYTGVHDVIIDGYGKFDCNKNLVGATASAFRIYHCKNITLRDVTIIDYPAFHAIEIGGSDGVLVENVKIYGAVYVPGVTESFEAINIELCTEIGANGAPPYDNTPAKNVTIRGCVFDAGNSGWCAAIGSHNNSNDYTIQNILIENCKFRNKSANPAANNVTSIYNHTIFLYSKFENVTIKNNTFENIHGSGIYASNSSSVLIENNNFNGIDIFAISFFDDCNTIQVINNTFIDCSRLDRLEEHEFRYPAIYLPSLIYNLDILNNIFIISSQYTTIPIHIPGSQVNQGSKTIAGNVFKRLIEYTTSGNKELTILNWKRYNNPVTLFKANSAAETIKTGSIPLSNDIRYYDRLMIVFTTDNAIFHSAMFAIDRISNNGSLSLSTVENINEVMTLYQCRGSFSGNNSVLIELNRRINPSNVITTYDPQGADTNFIGIYAVYGLQGDNDAM